MTPTAIAEPSGTTAAAPAPAPGSERAISTFILRFDRPTRLLHVVVMVTFLGLAATGMPLLFSDAPWARALAMLFFGFHGAGLVHRFFGIVLLGAVVWHFVNVSWRAFVRGESGLFWGPDSMVPQPRDFVHFYQQLRWFFSKGPRPKFERFAYWEKFDYWAVLWGTALMGAAGLVLWFPMAASRILPGWLFNVALFVHGAEATLAIVFIFAIHFFNGHLRPGKFPMDTVIFTGSVRREELRHERAGQYERLEASGDLVGLRVASPTPNDLGRGHLVGGIGVSLGVALFVLILYATLR